MKKKAPRSGPIDKIQNQTLNNKVGTTNNK